ncbi:hypothetical protein GIB67_016710 [Kingdonia uniflora]|uniref:Uncharacterized protein n=1 Tax=Kingdonia uniflora TaxID=39325 RepID=A0A7J7LMJ5_9MAGN|nr:hypothetical protein GIB67_016710 [Kingdonia uniflora]
MKVRADYLSEKELNNLTRDYASEKEVKIKEENVYNVDEKVARWTREELMGQIENNDVVVRPKDILVKVLLMVYSSPKNYLYKCDQLKSARQDLTVQRIHNELTTKVFFSVPIWKSQVHVSVIIDEGFYSVIIDEVIHEEACLYVKSHTLGDVFAGNGVYQIVREGVTAHSEDDDVKGGRYSDKRLLVSGNYEFDKKDPGDPLKRKTFHLALKEVDRNSKVQEELCKIRNGYFGRIDNLVIDQERVGTLFQEEGLKRSRAKGSEVPVIDDMVSAKNKRGAESSLPLEILHWLAGKVRDLALRDAKQVSDKKIEEVRVELAKDKEEALALLRSNFEKDVREQVAEAQKVMEQEHDKILEEVRALLILDNLYACKKVRDNYLQQYEMLEPRRDYCKGLTSVVGAVFEDSDLDDDVLEMPEVPSKMEVVDEFVMMEAKHLRELLDMFASDGLLKVDEVVSSSVV